MEKQFTYQHGIYTRYLRLSLIQIGLELIHYVYVDNSQTVLEHHKSFHPYRFYADSSQTVLEHLKSFHSYNIISVLIAAELYQSTTDPSSYQHQYNISQLEEKKSGQRPGIKTNSRYCYNTHTHTHTQQTPSIITTNIDTYQLLPTSNKLHPPPLPRSYIILCTSIQLWLHETNYSATGDVVSFFFY